MDVPFSDFLAQGACCGATGNTDGALNGSAVTNGNGALMSVQIKVFQCPSDNKALHIQGASSYYAPGGSLTGARTNYDFITNRNLSGYAPTAGCNMYKREPNTTRYMFGDKSTTKFVEVTDGLSNTFMIGETVHEVHNGSAPAWGYRGWVMTGVDPQSPGINIWGTGAIFKRGRLANW